MGKFKSKKAAPTYNRPTATGGAVTRAWKTVAIKDLQVGDIVAGLGIINLIQPTCCDDYYVEAGESHQDSHAASEQVYAFVKKEN